ncbi:aromatic/alkene monooxygenase hydroxylase subunit beta [Paraglaciecola sp. MB-3u-78]|uniref:aromatic/alkene monooxygenase hydroxylase subunit beta n=1 Tax=Paraglaciecola sp. MB-3u-78 TaxID=2058332 RepID=UPI000C347785|nr:aromatic/alkene monooxygenase hydroxylase subunit beta [Paraglaciecola sp. MB-3u-78]PKG98557.1 phenol hydroxylase [Paraglaciecola sp. MB-3u-78]
MSVEIKTNSVSTIRNTYSHIKRRFGDKPATRYQEASYDIEATENFHYKPLWDPQRSLNDASRTSIKMKDWYQISDPRQFYYGAYVGNRAKMQESAETSYKFCEKRDLISSLEESIQLKILKYLVPFRHLNLSANMNNSMIAGDSIATTVAQAHIYQSMDHLGMGQYLSRIALMIDGNTGAALNTSKTFWMDDPMWQPMRKLAEDSMVVQDWFELSLLQNLLIDKALFSFVYEAMDEWFGTLGAKDISMLTEFMRDWNKDTTRWILAVVKTAVAESDDNKEKLQAWVNLWEPQVFAALAPIAQETVGKEALPKIQNELAALLKKTGLQSTGAAL